MTVLQTPHAERVQDFFDQKRIAVSGLSRTRDSGAGAIYLKLKAHGYDVIPIHPQAEALHGDTCYPTLSAIPGGVDAVFIMNSPDVSEGVVREALDLGIEHVWMHNNTFMPSSVSERAVEMGREAGINMIEVGCPMMYLEPDFFHNCMGWVLKVTGRTK